MRVGFDLDGCVYDFGNSVRRYLNSIGRTYGFKDDQPEPHNWNFFEYWGMDYAEFKQICNDGADAGFVFCGETRPGAVQAIQRVKDLGHEIIIITDRQFGSTPEVSHKNTREWLAQHGIPFDELHFSADKTIVPTDIFVEDKWENFVALTEAGVDCYLINRPWNIEKCPEHPKRITDIMDYARIVEMATLVGYVDLAII